MDTGNSKITLLRTKLHRPPVEDLGGMEIHIESHENEPAITLLTGQVRDQAELMGILNSLY